MTTKIQHTTRTCLKYLITPFLIQKLNNTSSKESERIIKSIRVQNSHGYDGITNLDYICNKSIGSGTLSTHLKYSIVKPLFKKGDRENMANYRPISLLTSFSKVLGKIIYERLLQCININNISVEEQFAFRPANSR
jgi:hypothetical protein